MEKSMKRIDIWSVFMYLILYSIAGFFIETIFGLVTKGVIESRKSFIYGPFCAIYGIGAVCMIFFLRKEKFIWKLFFKGSLIGALVEYLMSLFFEKFFCVKWWDYSNLFFNIEGRTCLFYAISWGLLAIFLIKYVNPSTDRFIDYLRENGSLFKKVTAFIVLFFCFDALLSGYALKIFYYRIATQKDINITNKVYAQKKYDEIQEDTKFIGFVNNYFDNEKMIKTYPNIMIEDENKNIVYVDSLFNDYKVYYYRLGNFGNGLEKWKKSKKALDIY